MKFSIVIPVRNAANTIRATLESCLYSDYEDFEIVVHDNASTDTTKEIVNSFKNSKLVLSENESALYITDNWNEALNNATGDYVIFLGADDAIRKSTLKKLSSALDSHQVDSIKWSHAIYTWPSFGVLEQSNRISIPPITPSQILREVKSHDGELIDGQLPSLPSIYYGCVSRKLIETIKQSVKFFDSRSPDLYNAILMSYFTNEYLYLEDCLTVTGLSASSSGTAQLSQAPSLEGIRNDLSTLLESSQVRSSKEVPPVDLFAAWVMDCILIIEKQLKINRHSTLITPEHIGALIKKEIQRFGGVNSGHQKILVDWYLENGLSVDFDLTLPTFRAHRTLNPFPSSTEDLKIGQFYSLEATQFGIMDVFQAAKFIDAVETIYPILNLDQRELEGRTQAYEILLDDLKEEVVSLRKQISDNSKPDF